MRFATQYPLSFFESFLPILLPETRIGRSADLRPARRYTDMRKPEPPYACPGFAACSRDKENRMAYTLISTMPCGFQKQWSTYHEWKFFVSHSGVARIPHEPCRLFLLEQSSGRQRLLGGQHHSPGHAGKASKRAAADTQVSRGQGAGGLVDGGTDGGKQFVAGFSDEPADDHMPWIEDVAQGRHHDADGFSGFLHSLFRAEVAIKQPFDELFHAGRLVRHG